MPFADMLGPVCDCGCETPPSSCTQYCVRVTIPPVELDEDGAPGITVTLYKGAFTSTSPPPGNILATGTTDGDGYFCYDLPEDDGDGGPPIRPRYALVTAGGECLTAFGPPAVASGIFGISSAPVCLLRFLYCHVAITATISPGADPTITTSGTFAFTRSEGEAEDGSEVVLTSCYLRHFTGFGTNYDHGPVTITAETLSTDRWNGPGWLSACETVEVACGQDYTANVEQYDYSDCYVPITFGSVAGCDRGCADGPGPEHRGLMSRQMDVRLSTYPDPYGGPTDLGGLEGAWVSCPIVADYGTGGLSGTQVGWHWDSGCVAEAEARIVLRSNGIVASIYDDAGCSGPGLIRSVSLPFSWDPCCPCDLSFTVGYGGGLVLVEIRESCEDA